MMVASQALECTKLYRVTAKTTGGIW